MEEDRKGFQVEDVGEEEYEIVVEEETPTQESPAEDVAKGSREEFQKLMEELNYVKNQQAGTKELMAGLREVIEKVSTSKPPTQPPPEEKPKEDYLTFRKRIEELMVSDPVKGLEEMLGRYVAEQIAPAFQQLAGQTTATTLATSRSLAQQDPTNRMVMEKWGKEVEEVVRGLPPGPDVFDRACKQVAMGHLSEIIQLQVKEMEEKKKEEVPPAKGAVPTVSGAAQGVAKRVVKITPKEYEEARLLGLDPLTYKQMKGGK